MIENDPAKWCQCQACHELRAECGSHYAWLSRKLLQRGWAGKTSPAERAYIRAHAPWAIALAERNRANPSPFFRRGPRRPADSPPNDIEEE